MIWLTISLILYGLFLPNIYPNDFNKILPSDLAIIFIKDLLSRALIDNMIKRKHYPSRDLLFARAVVWIEVHKGNVHHLESEYFIL